MKMVNHPNRGRAAREKRRAEPSKIFIRDKPLASRAATAASRLIPEPWFRASTRQTTMAFLTGDHNIRLAPLGHGERRLGWFVLPPFQRPPVWTREQQMRFVESCWMRLPIGVFIFNRPDDQHSPFDTWLLDGQQRVTAVLSYMADEFAVFGHRFSELTDTDHRVWAMTTNFSCMETNLTDEAALREVYDRLAYGGTPHDPALRLA